MAVPLLLAAVPAALQQVRVWDGCFDAGALSVICSAGGARGHTLTSVFDRGGDSRQSGRSVLEQALCSLLDELGDRSRFIEYWWRDEWMDLEAHRDIDEELCRAVVADGMGLQRCPINGHVLYVDLEDGVSGTCCWMEGDAGSSTIPMQDDVDPNNDLCAIRGGPPRPLHSMVVVPAIPGRLLRFSGDMLHGVTRPALALLESGVSGGEQAAKQPLKSMRRAVLLFNTWEEPPLTPEPNAPLSNSEALPKDSLDKLCCLPRNQWKNVPLATAGEDDGPKVRLHIPLLGDECRRCTRSPFIKASGVESALRRALLEGRNPTQVLLETEILSEHAEHLVRIHSHSHN